MAVSHRHCLVLPSSMVGVSKSGVPCGVCSATRCRCSSGGERSKAVDSADGIEFISLRLHIWSVDRQAEEGGLHRIHIVDDPLCRSAKRRTLHALQCGCFWGASCRALSTDSYTDSHPSYV